MLVHAARSGLVHHEVALAALRELAEGSRPWGVPVFSLAEFARVITHPRIFDPPWTIRQAIDGLSSLTASPTLRILSPGPRFADLFAEQLRTGDARGNLAFDAQIVAVCLEQGVSELLTFDRDFARFPDLRMRVPGAH